MNEDNALLPALIGAPWRGTFSSPRQNALAARIRAITAEVYADKTTFPGSNPNPKQTTQRFEDREIPEAGAGQLSNKEAA